MNEQEFDPNEVAEKNGWMILPIPTYALCYLEYGDDSADNLDANDIENIKKFLEKWQYITPVTYPTENEDIWEPRPYFTWHPQFGLACDVEDCYCKTREKEAA